MTQEEDNILIEQIIKHKDQKASNKLYNWYYKEVKFFIKKKYGKLPSDDIDDLSSDAISKSFINLAAFDARKSSFRTWLYTIAENLVIDYARKLENRVDKIHYHYLEDAEERSFDIPSTENHEENYSAKQTINYVAASLNAIEHDMIKKKYVEGYSDNEIGDMYSVTSTTVLNKINYAKSKIRVKANKGR
jgi:RNA polymerase sigma factor (sigma-70 family)